MKTIKKLITIQYGHENIVQDGYWFYVSYYTKA